MRFLQQFYDCCYKAARIPAQSKMITICRQWLFLAQVCYSSCDWNTSECQPPMSFPLLKKDFVSSLKLMLKEARSSSHLTAQSLVFQVLEGNLLCGFSNSLPQNLSPHEPCKASLSWESSLSVVLKVSRLSKDLKLKNSLNLISVF